MIVYVETNFVLEIILGQEEIAHANEIVALAQSGRIQLLFPSFSLMEPLWTIRKRGKERLSIRRLLKNELTQLGRSVYHQEIVTLIHDLSSKIVNIELNEMEKLAETFSRIFDVATPIPLTKNVYSKSMDYQNKYALSPQDATVYSSIIESLEQQDRATPKLFISKNTKDFNFDNIKEELNTYNCRFLGNFEHALGYIRSNL